MAFPQMFDNFLNALKGWSPSIPIMLDFAAAISATVDFDVPAGRCMHLDTTGKFQTGCTGGQMAIFVRQASNDLDVETETSDRGQATFPAGIMSGLVATGGYELETTEFDTDLNYSPCDQLKAPHDNSDSTVGGVLTNAGITRGTTAVCGVVSRGVRVSHYKNSLKTLSFWPVYAPGSESDLNGT